MGWVIIYGSGSGYRIILVLVIGGRYWWHLITLIASWLKETKPNELRS